MVPWKPYKLHPHTDIKRYVRCVFTKPCMLHLNAGAKRSNIRIKKNATATACRSRMLLRQHNHRYDALLD